MGQRFCPNCGKPVALDAKFCAACGTTLAAQQAPPTPPTPTYSAPIPSYQPAPRKSNDKLILGIVILVFAVLAALGAVFALGYFNSISSHTMSIVNGAVAVPPGRYYYYQITVPSGATAVSITGSFTASGGSGNDIVVLVFDQTNYVNWENGHPASTYYNSGQVTTGTVDASLPGPGTYYLVYSNTFSTFSTKNVQTTVDLTYRG